MTTRKDLQLYSRHAPSSYSLRLISLPRQQTYSSGWRACRQEESEGASVCRPAVRAAAVEVTAGSVRQTRGGSCHTVCSYCLYVHLEKQSDFILWHILRLERRKLPVIPSWGFPHIIKRLLPPLVTW